MITSYVTPQQSMLYLSLVGALDAEGADGLVNEYYDRHAPGIRPAILDLSGAESSTESGLDVLHRLSLLTQVDGVEFTVVSRGSGVRNEVIEAAKHYWVPVVDSIELPFAPQPLIL